MVEPCAPRPHNSQNLLEYQTIMKQREMTQEEYKTMLNKVADLAVNYGKTGNGYFTMSEAFNELAEACAANKGINLESTIDRRKILAQAVCIQCIRPLSRSELNRVDRELKSIAEDFSPRRGMHR